MKENTIFSAAEICLPSFAANDERMAKWAVIACDQFTSEISYWEKCRNFIGEHPSAYRYILPEAYLGKEQEKAHREIISESMKAFSLKEMMTVNGLIYLERTLPNGSVRHGIIGKIDLEKYDYSAGSKSAVRATEATVVERIPPRCAIRSSAEIELPHILVLIDDKYGVFDKAKELSKSAEALYDFDLMLGGGHVSGYGFTGRLLDEMMEAITEYERKSEGVVYAMGDGNHSLAAAKALWEQRKSGGAAEDDPARYALCEITALGDESLEFEPIYRVLTGIDVKEFEEAFASVSADGDGEQTVIMVTAEGEKTVHFTEQSHALTVGTLQNFIDQYISEHTEAECDYIHGEDVLRKLACEKNSVGFLMDGMDKNDLFGYVDKHGTLPRKTFSMGEAESKRYYIEARKITK